VFAFRKSDEDDEASADDVPGPFSHPEPTGRSLIVRADHFHHARRLFDSIFGPGTELALYAERLRQQGKKP
jgi:hypothetical protein